MAVVDGRDRLLLQHNRKWAPGFRSVTAGFVEAGENLEHAVRRETMEEVGLNLGEMRYLGSQPWPFPSSLMVAFRARSLNTNIRVDGEETDEANWFTREEFGAALASGRLRIPQAASVARYMAVIAKDQALEDLRAGRPWRFREVLPDRAKNGIDRLYSIGPTDNPSYQAPGLRYIRGSYGTPAELRELDPVRGVDRLLKRARVLGDFKPERYAERRILVRVRDGALVPVSLVWRRGMHPALDASGRTGPDDTVIQAPDHPERRPWPDQDPDRSAPMFITGYGAYEISQDPGFSTGRLSLLDRGVLYAVPHVRGGGEMGRAWYEQGRRLHKVNTFLDFIDVTAALQAQGWADPRHTVANGGSAGGLLMGAVANMAPQLYAGIEADVPFVDALTSILDRTCR